MNILLERIKQIQNFLIERESPDNLHAYTGAAPTSGYSTQLSPNASFMSCRTRSSKDQRIREVLSEMEEEDRAKLASRLLRVERAQRLKREVEER